MSLLKSFSDIYKRSEASTRLGNLPWHFYIVDTKGNALYLNDTFAEFLRRDDSLDLTNKFNTYDIIPAKEADKIKHNNESVLKNQKEMIFAEHFTFDKYETKTAISIKAPFRDLKRNLRGIIGISFIRDSHADHQTIKNQFTPKKIECLYYLVKGYTYVEIANKICLSPRTIEHYIDDLYAKFQCNKRHQLVAHALKIEEIKLRLLMEE